MVDKIDDHLLSISNGIGKALAEYTDAVRSEVPASRSGDALKMEARTAAKRLALFEEIAKLQ